VTKVLITGANGFIGSHLARQLVKEKFEIFATKRNNSNLIRCNDYADMLFVSIFYLAFNSIF
jgi:nucleoside-diphosphate-sugar epimerase